MDFTWYLYPGQTLENTTPEQRGKALMATPSAWKKIANRQGQKKIKQELLDQEHARNEYLKEGSKAMTQNWANTIEVRNYIFFYIFRRHSFYLIILLFQFSVFFLYNL